MGNLFSWNVPPPTPPMERPWRPIGKKGQEVQWNEETETDLRKKCLQHDLKLGGKQVPILLMGASGSGKSSFINSLYTALTDEELEYTFAARSSGKSVTKIIFNPILHVQGGEPYFRFLDSPGLSENDDKFFEEFVDHALNGRLKENVEYKPPQIPTDGEHFNANPGELDRPCLVVFVITADDMIDEGKIKQKLQIAKDLAGCNGIKLIVVLTKADLASGLEQYCLKNGDIQYIFHSEAIFKAVNKASEWAELPQNRIFPVTNYTDQTETCTEMNIVLLYTLSKLLGNAKLEAKHRLAELGQE